jgi:hypothetical protein
MDDIFSGVAALRTRLRRWEALRMRIYDEKGGGLGGGGGGGGREEQLAALDFSRNAAASKSMPRT